MAEMRLDSDIQYLKGVGPRRAAALSRVGIISLRDLLHFLPRRYIDRTTITSVGALKANMNATIVGKILGKGILKGKRSRLEVVIGDETGYVAMIWFAGYHYLEKAFNKGEIYAVTGPVTYFQQLQFVHPEVERIEDEEGELIHTGRIVPVYPSTAELKEAGLSGRVMRQIINRALELMADKLPDFLPEVYCSRYQLMPIASALRQIHYPDAIEKAESARRRLAFDEILELQYLILNARKHYTAVKKKQKCGGAGKKVATFLSGLPFRPTSDQEAAVQEIFHDMESERPMHRLLQGDVGCGKTVVALLAAIHAAEYNMQTAFMAPTELLAEQHYRNWREPLQKMGINSTLIIGGLNKKQRQESEEEILSGRAAVAFGTHAVLAEPVRFDNLGLVIIDEQHRFGVMQRGKLIGKGAHPDVLVMTATPIPRTLALTLYGDLDITSIKTMPPGRKPCKTFWRTAASRPEIYTFLRTKLAENEQIFVIYPLVEKSEKLDLQAAEEEYKRLKDEVFTDVGVGLVHGRLKKDVREKTIKEFREGKIKILVATTVIEVGIDIPAASIMVIEHAERFGLSQLHQLRGRVGRGEKRGMTIAVATPPLSELARQRLEMFQESSDGFRIAEADLKLRGPGEFFGTRQHGLPELKIADLAVDTDLLPVTRKIAIHLLADDKKLDISERNLLTYLAEKGGFRQTLTRFG
ncbi:MAG: ATP-dependent DNA helicase RecG [candidate division Zixibacteria bacterium]|nr:ATP-dependent DNA helicase RecG [candidate division Zixibacteria bacterium]